MLVRHGVRLSPKKADLFDMIDNVTRAGSRISLISLAEIFYPRASLDHGRNCVKATVHQINDLLESTDVMIRAGRGDGYRIEQRSIQQRASVMTRHVRCRSGPSRKPNRSVNTSLHNFSSKPSSRPTCQKS
jgi:hypothetical protein